MQSIGIVTVARELVGHILCLLSGAAENEAKGSRVVVEETAKHRVALIGLYHDIQVLDVGISALLTTNGELVGIFHVFLCNAAYTRRHGGRKQPSVPGGRGVLQDVVNFLFEAHVEHLIGLVEHQNINLVELHGFALYQVAQATWRGNNNLCTGSNIFHLSPNVGASVNYGHAESRKTYCKTSNFFSNLHAELTRWRDNQPLGVKLECVN